MELKQGTSVADRLHGLRRFLSIARPCYAKRKAEWSKGRSGKLPLVDPSLSIVQFVKTLYSVGADSARKQMLMCKFRKAVIFSG